MKLSAMNITLKDLRSMVEDKIEEEADESPENVTIRLTLSDSLIEDLKEGKDTVDIELKEDADEMFLLTWEQKENDEEAEGIDILEDGE
jgi:hypothetical protein